METHLSDLTVSLRRRRRGNERKARISEIPGVGKGLKMLSPVTSAGRRQADLATDAIACGTAAGADVKANTCSCDVMCKLRCRAHTFT